MADIDTSYKNIVEHIINIRFNDLKEIEGEDVRFEQQIRLYDEFIGMIRLASVVCDVPFQNVLDNTVDVIFNRMLMQAGEDEEIVGLAESHG